MKSIPCERCGKLAPGHDLTHFTTEAGVLLLCSKCFNADVAQRVGIRDFDNHPLDPISITAADDVVHQFHFQTRLLGAMVTLEAYEIKDGEPSGLGLIHHVLQRHSTGHKLFVNNGLFLISWIV